MMNTEKGFDLMADVLPYIAEILNDPDCDDAVADLREKGPNAESGDLISKLLPIFITKHRSALYSIAAAFAGKTVEAVREQPLAVTVADLNGGCTGEMMAFFVWCLRMSRAM